MFEIIGGRKFVMAILIAATGALIDFFGKNGLSANMAGLLTLIYGTFAASNAVITNKQLSTSVTSSEQPPVEQAPPPEPAIKKEEVNAAFSAVDQAFSQLQGAQNTQAEQINTLQKAVSTLLTRS
jgi:hypothetical protein